jgi:amino acid permease
MTTAPAGDASRLARRLGTTDAVVIGLGSMIGAGVFVALAPAARAAGQWLLAGLAVAAVVAYCNATSSARLAARYPSSGGTYVYGRERLGPFWGYLAGWAFVVGKTASCAAMALTFAAYAASGYERPAAVVAVLGLTALNWHGVHTSAVATRVIVGVVIAVLAATVIAGLSSRAPTLGALLPDSSFPVLGVLQAAGLLFFAFAGYARIATLGEEARDPRRTIPRAIPLALGITLVVYAAVAVTAIVVLGPDRLAAATAPLADLVTAAGAGWLAPVVRVGAAVAALGSLLALILGVTHELRDGPGPGPAGRVGRRAPPVSGAAPGGTRRRCDRRGRRRGGGPARGDRLLIVRCAAVLRHRQRGRVHPHPRGEPAAAHCARRPRRVPPVGRQPAPHGCAHRDSGRRPRRAALRRPAHLAEPYRIPIATRGSTGIAADLGPARSWVASGTRVQAYRGCHDRRDNP